MRRACCQVIATLLMVSLCAWLCRAEASTGSQTFSLAHPWRHRLDEHSYCFEQKTTFSASRFEPGRKQLYEWSCGPAALANLLSVFFGCPIDENAVAAEDSPKPGRRATLAELLESARRLGFGAAVYLMDVGLLQLALTELCVPMIGLLCEPEGHFVIAAGLVHRDILVFDPSLGYRLLSEGDLRDRWSGFALVVDPGTERIDACSARIADLVHRFEQRRDFLDEPAWIIP